MRTRTLALLSLVAGCSAGVAKEGGHGTDNRSSQQSETTGQTGSPRVARTASLFDGRKHAAFELTREHNGLTAAATRLDAVRATHTILEGQKDKLHMLAPARELRPTWQERDDLGMTHARFEQTVGGVPVVGAELMAHFDSGGRVTSIDSYYVPGIEGVDTSPELTAKEAENVAVKDAAIDRSERGQGLVLVSEPRLVIYTEEGRNPALAWEAGVRSEQGSLLHFRYAIDAKTGTILHKLNNLMSVEATGSGTLNDSKKIQVTEANGGYQMIDATRSPAGLRTHSAGNTENLPGTLVTSNSLTTWPPAAVDAHAYAGVVYDFYKTNMQRLSIDGRDGPLTSVANFGREPNAFWTGSEMVYGDGDGQRFRAFSVSLDVVAHELTHGVTQYTSNLVYQDQSGALNESVSDIFGILITHSYKPDPVKDWLLGEDLSVNGQAYRDAAHPSKGLTPQPAHMSELVKTQQDNGGVHINSGIPNNAMYLMTVGGTNDVSKIAVPNGIGWNKVAQLWYRANSKYFTANTDFAGAARGTLSAAQDLGFSQDEQNIVECAWIAVGVAQGTCKQVGAPGQSGSDAGTGGQNSPPPPQGGGNAPGGTGGGTSPGGNASDPGSDDTSGAQPEADDDPSDSKPKRTALGAGASENSGCRAAPSRSTESGSLLLVLGAAALARVRRRRQPH